MATAIRRPRGAPLLRHLPPLRVAAPAAPVLRRVPRCATGSAAM